MTSPRTVFVLDVSGSMHGERLRTLNLSVKRYIEDIPDGYYVGIVLFESKVWIQHEVVQITGRAVRDSLIAKCPDRVYNDNDFAGGLQMGLTALTNANLKTEGSTFVFVTDGEDTWSGLHYGNGLNYVDIALPDLLKAKIRVICIAIGHSADPNLERLSRETEGNTYSVNESNNEMTARIIEASMKEVKRSNEMSEVTTVSVCNDLTEITGNSFKYDVIIDSDIGRHTCFTVNSENIDKFSLSILSPNGTKYDNTSVDFTKNQSLKRYQLKLKSAESGVWSVCIVKHCSQTLFATISVISQAINPNAIQMNVSLKEVDINTKTPPIIMAQIVKGSDAVIGAEVLATIEIPNGTQKVIKLVNHNDIYCNFFTDYCGSGRYNVSVLAMNRTNICTLKSGKSVPRFQRQLISGCFKIDGYMPLKPDNDMVLQTLPLNKAFSTLSLDSNVAIEAPLPRNAKATFKSPVPKKSIEQIKEMKSAKEDFWESYLAIKKSINSSSKTEIEKNSLKNEIEVINALISKSTSIHEIKSNHDKLKEIKAKISLL